MARPIIPQISPEEIKVAAQHIASKDALLACQDSSRASISFISPTGCVSSTNLTPQQQAVVIGNLIGMHDEALAALDVEIVQ